jgi:hypothetical protein
MQRKFNHKNKAERVHEGIEFSSELIIASALQAAAAGSPLLSRVLTHQPAIVAARFVNGLKRGPVDVSLNGWILASAEGSQVIGRVSEMVMVAEGEKQLVFLLSKFSHAAAYIPEEDDGMIRVQKIGKPKSVLILLESSCITNMLCKDKGDHFALRYMF